MKYVGAFLAVIVLIWLFSPNKRWDEFAKACNAAGGKAGINGSGDYWVCNGPNDVIDIPGFDGEHD